MSNSKNISIAVYDDVLKNIENSSIEKVKIIKTNVLKNLKNNPNDRLINDLLIVCREKIDNKKTEKISFLKKLIG